MSREIQFEEKLFGLRCIIYLKNEKYTCVGIEHPLPSRISIRTSDDARYMDTNLIDGMYFYCENGYNRGWHVLFQDNPLACKIELRKAAAKIARECKVSYIPSSGRRL